MKTKDGLVPTHTPAIMRGSVGSGLEKVATAMMETFHDSRHGHLRNYNLREVDCDPLRKIKRPIGYILLEEFCATSDE